jgi:RHS repeat-associated protein
MGGRTSAQDYSSETDGLRQKFTGYERDIETGLDYAQARYYGSIMGRFTSPDPLLSSGEPENPQTWNRYSYALNNPLLYTDPFGLYVYGNNVTDEQKKQFEEALDQAKSYLKKIKETYGPNSNEYKKAERALNAYGKPGEDNGVTVIASSKVGAGETTLNNNKTITVAFNPKQFGSDFFQALVGHEGSHVADTKNYLATGNSPTKYQYEYDGYFVQSVLGEAQAKEMNYVNYYASTGGTKTAPEKKVDLWNKSWAEADKAMLRSKAINEFLAIPKKDGGYGLSPRDKGKALFITQPRRRRR